MDIEERDGHGVLAVQGRLNLSNADEFRYAVGEALQAGSVRLVVDLTAADSVDSTGLGALIWAATSARREGGWLKLTHANESVRMLLKLANTSSVLPIVEDTESN